MTAEAAAVARRTVRVLVAAQVLAGVGLAAGITVGALLAEDMIGSTSSAGVPTALFTAGSAGAALLVGRVSQAHGRRPGLAAGYGVGALGAAGVVAAAALDSVALLFVMLFVYGAGLATNLQARYAGADLVAPAHRGRAVSTVLVATTLGAVVGPNLVDATGDVAESLGVRALAGPFMLAGIGYGLAALAVVVLLRPDPLLLARRLARDAQAPVAGDDGPPAPAEPDRPDPQAARTLRIAAAAMVVTQAVMAGIMTMTPIHMRDHGHGLSAAGLVISIHVAAMYLPSPLSGYLADRAGRRATLALGAATLLAAGVLAALAPTDSMVLLTVALALLGIGWSLGLVGGTALVTDAAPLATRARTQGRVDLCVALAGAAGGVSSGIVVDLSGYETLSLLGGALALAMVPLLFATSRRRTALGRA